MSISTRHCLFGTQFQSWRVLPAEQGTAFTTDNLLSSFPGKPCSDGDIADGMQPHSSLPSQLPHAWAVLRHRRLLHYVLPPTCNRNIIAQLNLTLGKHRTQTRHCSESQQLIRLSEADYFWFPSHPLKSASRGSYAAPQEGSSWESRPRTCIDTCANVIGRVEGAAVITVDCCITLCFGCS